MAARSAASEAESCCPSVLAAPLDAGDAEDLAHVFAALADPVRLRCLIDPGARNFMNRIHGAAGFRRSWDVIVAGEFGGTGGKTDLFFYDRAAGEGEFYRIDPGARNFMNRLGGGAGFRDSWTAIVPGNFGRGPLADLFFYDSSA